MQTIHRDCVVGLIVSGDGKILMGKKDPRAGGVFPDCWHLPGGGIEPGESQQEALRREIKEEVGIDIVRDHADFIDGSGYAEAEKKDQGTGETVLMHMNFYVFKIQLGQAAAEIPVELNGDLVKFVWATPQELDNYVLTPPSVELFAKMGYL